MPAGLLPADSLNHIRDAMGIPDSAFPGNALSKEFEIQEKHSDAQQERAQSSGIAID
jgi:hypothetical protein